MYFSLNLGVSIHGFMECKLAHQTIKQSGDICFVLAVCNDLLEEPASHARPTEPGSAPRGATPSGACGVAQQWFRSKDSLLGMPCPTHT